MVRSLGLPALFAVLVSVAGGCASASSIHTDDDDIKVDTSTPEARRQYDANVTFARSYAAQCARALPPSSRPRVLVTGFGRFMSIANNATGRIVSTLVPRAGYPETQPPAPGAVDLPGPQLSVGAMTLELPGAGSVDVCAMILPVYWDLAAILIAKEAEAFTPSFVMMNGVAGPTQPLWIELGATNRATRNYDGSDLLAPAIVPGQELVKLIESAPASEDAQSNLLSWRAVEASARAAVARHAREVDNGLAFGDIASGASLAGFPRLSNTYICNNVTYTIGWLMSHPGQEARLLRASVPVPGAINEVRAKVGVNLESVPRVFVHWPSELADRHHAAAADVMRSIIAAQIGALRSGDRPTPGNNSLADPALAGGGEFF
jgi:pyrrolidone-carboxylate peptidase